MYRTGTVVKEQEIFFLNCPRLLFFSPCSRVAPCCEGQAYKVVQGPTRVQEIMEQLFKVNQLNILEYRIPVCSG